jgi:hypothetical protein
MVSDNTMVMGGSSRRVKLVCIGLQYWRLFLSPGHQHSYNLLPVPLGIRFSGNYGSGISITTITIILPHITTP